MKFLAFLAVLLLSTACSNQRSVAKPAEIGLPDVVVATKSQVPAGPLLAGHSFAQTFVAEHNGLSKVEVMAATYAAKIPSGELIIHLCQYPNIEQEIATVTVPARSIKDNSFVTLAFTPLAHSRAHSYYLYLEARDIPPKYSLTFWRSSGDVYPGGRFFVDGQPQPSDLSFRSFYKARPSAAVNGFLISCKEDGRLYLAQKGRVRLILDGDWIAAHGYGSQQPVSLSMAEIHEFPVGPCLLYIPAAQLATIGAYTVVLFLFFYFAIYKKSWLSQAWNNASNVSLGFLSSNHRVMALGAFIALMWFRAPWLITHPRFWAEEGTAWFQYASAHSIIRDIVYIYPDSGYMNLMANVGGVLSSRTAHLLNLAYAPLATTVAALGVQTMAIGVILFGKSRLFTSPTRSIAGCLIVLFAPTSLPEVWLNTINSMSYLGLIALIVLFVDVSAEPIFAKWAMRILLVLCGLSAAYSVALLPLYILSFFLYRERERKLQCYILAACLAAQIAFVIFSKFAGGGLPNRGGDLSAGMSAINVLFWHIMVPTLGRDFALMVFGTLGFTDAWLTSSFYPHLGSTEIRTAGVICFLIIAAVFYLLLAYGRSRNKVLLSGAFLIMAILTCAGSLHSVPSGRYAFIPGIVFLLLLLSNIQSGARTRSIISMLILAFALANGMLSYSIKRDPTAPKWRDEVAKWRVDHNYQLKVDPSFWTSRVTYLPGKRN